MKVFANLLQNVSRVRKCIEVFGCIYQIGPLWAHSDLFGRIRTRLDAHGCVWPISENSENFIMFGTSLGVSGRLRVILEKYLLKHV